MREEGRSERTPARQSARALVRLSSGPPVLRLPAGYLTLIHVFYGIMRLVVQMFDEFVLVLSSVFAQCISRLLVHLVFVSGYINHTTYGFGFRSDQMYAIHRIDLRLEQPDL